MNQKKIYYGGESMNIAQWAESIGVNKATLAKRLRKGISFQQAIRSELYREIQKEKNQKEKIKFLQKLKEEEDRRWQIKVNEGIESYHFHMMLKGCYKKEHRVFRYRQLNGWYKEFLMEDMKVA